MNIDLNLPYTSAIDSLKWKLIGISEKTKPKPIHYNLSLLHADSHSIFLFKTYPYLQLSKAFS